MKDIISLFASSEDGATAVEYAIMASAIAAVIVLIVTALGLSVLDLFNRVSIP